MSPPPSNLFRRSALDRLSSPEQLDRVVTLADPVGWAAVTGALGLILSALLWGIFGDIPTKVDGDGILIAGGGSVVDAVGPASGRLAGIEVGVGATVRVGQVVARLDQTETDRAYRDALAMVSQLEDELARLKRDQAGERRAKERIFSDQQAAERQLIAEAGRRRAFLEQSIRSLTDLARQAVVPSFRVEEARKDEAAVDQQIGQAKSDLARIEAERQALAAEQGQSLSRAEVRLDQARRSAADLKATLEANSRVLSPADGTVTEIKASPGAILSRGAPLLSIVKAEGALQMVAFVPPEMGKLIQRGMTAHIEPSTVHKEEFGTLLGRVSAVSEFPATIEGMRSVLQNDRLIAQFSSQGPPFIVHVALEPDPKAPSRYRWSSGLGPAIRLGSGTPAKVQVTVREQAPISLVLPTLRKAAGIVP